MNTTPENTDYYVPCCYCGEDVLIDGSVYPAPAGASHKACRQAYDAILKDHPKTFACILPDGTIVEKNSTRPLAFLVAAQNTHTGSWCAIKFTTRYDLAAKYAPQVQKRLHLAPAHVHICGLVMISNR